MSNINNIFPFYHGSFSNWYQGLEGNKKYQFIVDGQEYNCSEQYMMVEKAKLFNDDATKTLILKSKSPREQKTLGRKVKGFDQQIWNKNRDEIMYQGLKAKFSQNPKIKKELLDTGDKIICEASPYDKIWGVGLSVNNPSVYDKSKWKGLNLLGKALMRVRDDYKKNNQNHKF